MHVRKVLEEFTVKVTCQGLSYELLPSHLEWFATCLCFVSLKVATIF
jgi:hypothetical protein